MAKLPIADFERIVEYIRKISVAPRRHGSKKLRGSNFYRIRSGDYRIVYEIDDESRFVHVLAVGHRREVYRGL